MTNKVQTQFVCQNCGASTNRWEGKCPDCGAWNTLVETVFSAKAKAPANILGSKPMRLSEVDSKRTFVRTKTGIAEFDRVLGGGIVPGSLVLIGGEPGIGKSTIVLQIAAELSRAGKKVLYVSGEESLEQIKLRAERIGADKENMHLYAETDVDSIVNAAAADKPDLLIIDSIQTLASSEIHSAPGNAAQITNTAASIQNLAKTNHIAVFLIGHVTKGGTLAGPKLLEHLVDTVLYFEGERSGEARVLRSYKNRFGPTSETGIFEMRTSGLVEVLNPSELFIKERVTESTGSVIYPMLEGSRPLLVEIQALTSTTTFPSPRRAANGVDLNRLMLLLAVLNRRANINLGNQDVYVNVVGGLRISEPAADLAVCLAIYSAYKGVTIPATLAAFGEVGLSGEVRKVPGVKERVAEATKLGFKSHLGPDNIKSLAEAIKKTH